MGFRHYDFSGAFKLISAAICLAAFSLVVFIPISFSAVYVLPPVIKMKQAQANAASPAVEKETPASATAQLAPSKGKSVRNYESALLEGGLSPDGRYEARIFKFNDLPEPNNYKYAICPVGKGKKPQFLDLGGGYFNYDAMKGEAKALWHPSSKCLAISDRSSNHSSELYFVSFLGGRFQPVAVDESYLHNALGRVDMVSRPLFNAVQPLAWDGDSLRCVLLFKQAGSSVNYSVDFSFEISDWTDGSPSEFRLGSMEQPQPDDE
jgi:hypothetical protein